LNGREERRRETEIRVDQAAGFEEYGGLENGGWGMWWVEGNKAREQERGRGGVWTTGPRRAGGLG
jgi:hypothetical protein